MRMARIGFNRATLLNSKGISVDLWKQMLDQLPKDSSIIGFGYDSVRNVDYMLITSDQFKDMPYSGHLADITPHFSITNGIATCTHIDFHDVKDPNVPCLHSWQTHVGFNSTYEYCKLCNVRKG